MENGLVMPMLTNEIVMFQLVLFRLVAFCVVVPYLGTKNIPRQFALYFAAGISLVIAPRLIEIEPIDVNDIDIFVAFLQNMLVGFLYGAALLCVFEIISICGSMIAYASGLGMLQMVDPSSGNSGSVITNVINIIFGLVFISGGGLLLVIEFFAGSFGAYPVTGMEFEAITFKLFAEELVNVFKIGIMIALPFTGVSLTMNVALAVVSKSAPAMNLFTIGFPLSVLLGVLALCAVMPFIVADLYSNVLSLSENYQRIL